MKCVLLSVLLCLSLGAPVWAASGVDSLRAEARTARGQVRELRDRQQLLRAELNTLAGRIELLKAEQKGRLVAGPELEAALRQSQELSGQLSGLAQSLAGAETEAERRNLALHAALSDELARVRAAWDATSDREARSRLISRMRELRTERDALRSALPASQVPALHRGESSDDPEDLLEQADALRDSEDKVRQRLGVLKTRIAEVREERALERRMSDFLGEEAMFDEQDRRLRLRVGGGEGLRVDATPPGGGSTAVVDDARDMPPGYEGPNGPSIPPPEDFPDGPQSPVSTPSIRASDGRPQVEALRAQQLAAGDFDDLSSLEAEARRLESLARELDSRAQALERQVRELE